MKIIALSCGCFFHGRKFYADPACSEHHDAEESEEPPR